MKLIAAALSIVLFGILGCDHDSSGSTSAINIDEQNLLGKWYIKGGTVNGGPFENYHHNCPSKKDYQEFGEESVIFIEYGTDCTISDNELGGWHLDGNRLSVYSYDPVVHNSFNHEYTIMSITSQELKLRSEYEAPEGTIIEISTFTRN